ncbi:DUF3868 domain-containing protein [uncultured Duncaniella sp.]|uniref:DUF3868 domain-containing protein n=1 Tax=uncultured Duncaniella sp. TaxID=2768039 RepID=UPI0026745F2B|nr:DUF3868 domain-containing protein [uncultured Duncaniella sp.]MCI9171527.1 DUF3868 domain-containing protein [Muribaculaceae bacterium]
MKLHKFILSLSLLALAGTSAYAGEADVKAADVYSPLKVYDMSARVDEQARTLALTIDLNMADMKLPINREMIFTPVIISADGTQSLELSPVIVAGRNRYYWHLRNADFDAPGTKVYRAGEKDHAIYKELIDFQPWMQNSTVEMRQQGADCCDDPVPFDGGSPNGNVELARIDTRRPAIVDEFVFTPPVDAGPVIKALKGSAFVTFVVNRTELKPDYMINRQELKKITGSIDLVRNDKDATITHVHIKGFASPEGPYANNVRLAQGRTETLRRYVRDLYAFNDTTITSSYEPEDWDGLRHWVKDSVKPELADRAGLLAVIDDKALEPDARDRALKTRFPKDYAVILRDIYPWLRHSDYTVTYSIRTYNTVDEILAVYNQDPTRLRNVDFFTLAQSYPVGSDQYCAVMEKAVEVYPDDPGSNLNAANIEMRRGDLDKAQTHLLKSGKTPQAIYARGVLAAKRGDYREARELFTQAKQAGVPQAQNYLDKIEQIQNHSAVTITVPLTK